jgi:hypothetical protein
MDDEPSDGNDSGIAWYTFNSVSCPNLRRFSISKLDNEVAEYMRSTFKPGFVSELVIENHTDNMP